jgi:hypothetical protein
VHAHILVVSAFLLTIQLTFAFIQELISALLSYQFPISALLLVLKVSGVKLLAISIELVFPAPFS